jgi:acetyltransferase-like isoleucine patch superfamily enzyme
MRFADRLHVSIRTQQFAESALQKRSMTNLNSNYFSQHELRALPFKNIGRGILLDKTVSLVCIENISIGNNVRIDAHTMVIATGQVTIGSHVHISAHSYLAGRAGVILSDFCNLSSGVRIYSINDDYSGSSMTSAVVPEPFKQLSLGQVILGRHVIIGSGSIILPGVHVADGCAVGALSLINKKTEPWGIYAGIPARRLRDRSRDLLALEKNFLNQFRTDES